MEGAPGWEALLQRSRQQLSSMPGAQTTFPPIQRSLVQLEEFSRRLNSRRPEGEAREETIAASRLLAREGINAEQLSSALSSFELQTTFEDVFPREATSVEDYIRQVHDMCALAAIQKVQRDTQAGFESYMQHSIQEEWHQQRRSFLQSLSGPQVFSPEHGGTRPLLLEGTTDKLVPLVSGGPRALQLLERDLQGMGSTPASERKAAAYAKAVEQFNRSWELKKPIKVASQLAEAFAKEGGTAAERAETPWWKVWALVQAMVDHGEGQSLKLEDLILGARHYLETRHSEYMELHISDHHKTAHLGGVTSNLHKVRAFLRVKLRNQGLLDFDAGDAPRQPPIDTTWWQIYLCLRSGYHDEALQVARSSQRSSSVSPLLQEWIQNKGQVSGRTAAFAAQECDDLARIPDRNGKPTYDKRKMLVYAIIAGGKRQADGLLRDTPVLFSNIEDFLWFRLSMLRLTAATSSDSPPQTTLEDLQAYLKSFPASYYTKQGQDPLLYLTVLLASVQLETAVSHLLQMPPGNQKLDGLHICLALSVSGSLLASSKSEKVAITAASQVASTAENWGTSLLQRSDASAALEYYVIAAIAEANGRQSKEYDNFLQKLLRKMLRSYHGRFLLLSDGTQSTGQLKRFLAEEADRRKITLYAAEECQNKGLFEEEVELRRLAGDFVGALKTVVQVWSNAIDSIASGRPEADARAQELGDFAKRLEVFASAPGQEQSEQLAVLKSTVIFLESIQRFYRDFRSGTLRTSLEQLKGLDFLPLSSQSVEAALSAAQNLPREVEDRLPALLESVAACMDGILDKDGTVSSDRKKLSQFVSASVGRNWPDDLYARIGDSNAWTPTRMF